MELLSIKAIFGRQSYKLF